MTAPHITIDIVLAEEFAVLAAIGKTTFYETWREVNSEEDMQLYMKTAFAIEKIKEEVSDVKINLFFLARVDEHVVGYVKLRRDRTYDDFNGAKVIEIERIYVRKEFQKKKIGKRLMDRCIEIAKSEQHQWLWLGVNTENTTAIQFYKKYGFEVFGSKSFQLGSAVDQDYLMKLKLDR